MITEYYKDFIIKKDYNDFIEECVYPYAIPEESLPDSCNTKPSFSVKSVAYSSNSFLVTFQ